MSVETTQRGFRIFGEVDARYGRIRVTESSIAFQGAHCWIFQNAEGGRESQAVHLNVEQAKEVIKALQTFISEAEEGKLTEPATYAEG